MFHGTLTLLTRSLRLDALQYRAHTFRIVSVTIVFLMLLATHLYTGGRGSPGLKFFSLICDLCLGLITVAGAGHFATAITEEKEAGTLNLLLLANVPALAVLVGKSTTRLVSVLLVFVGLFPFALLALALGGATAHQVWSGLLALAAYLVLVANIGLLASVVRPTGSGAAIITIALVITLLAGPFLLSRVAAALIGSGWASAGGSTVAWLELARDSLARFSIVDRLQRIQSTGFHESAWSFQVIGSLLAGGGLFLLAWGLFSHFCQYLGDDAPARFGVLRVRSGQRPAIWRRLLTPRPWRNPLIWKDFHFLVGGMPGLIARCAIIPLIGAGLFAIDRLLAAGMNLNAPDALRISLMIAAGLEAIALSARVFNTEYRRQTLCTLILLPRSTLAICYSKVAGSALVLVPYLVWFLAIGSTFAIDLEGLAGVYLLDPTSLVIVCLAILLMHLTAWLSLFVKWGALPLATMLLMVSSSCLTPFVALFAAFLGQRDRSGYQGIYPIVYLTLLICAALQIAIGLRFRRAAAE